MTPPITNPLPPFSYITCRFFSFFAPHARQPASNPCCTEGRVVPLSNECLDMLRFFEHVGLPYAYDTQTYISFISVYFSTYFEIFLSCFVHFTSLLSLIPLILHCFHTNGVFIFLFFPVFPFIHAE